MEHTLTSTLPILFYRKTVNYIYSLGMMHIYVIIHVSQDFLGVPFIAS